MEMNWGDFFLGITMGMLFLILVSIVTDTAQISRTEVAEMVCESHGLELDYFEGSLDKIVCEDRPEDLSNKKVFEFG